MDGLVLSPQEALPSASSRDNSFHNGNVDDDLKTYVSLPGIYSRPFPQANLSSHISNPNLSILDSI